MLRVAFVAAMEREVAPLVRRWNARWIEQDGRRFRLFENGEAAVICGGIGPEAARRATEAVIRAWRPDRVMSVGFAGALDESLEVGAIVEPRTVINVADGARMDTGSGSATLVSLGNVGDAEQKRKLHDVYAAAAVDMEAGAVAQGAEARGVQFGALKVISDAADFELPPLEKFIGEDRSFRTMVFAFHVMLRPWLWRSTITLGRNSARASRALCAAIEAYLRNPVTASQRMIG